MGEKQAVIMPERQANDNIYIIRNLIERKIMEYNGEKHIPTIICRSKSCV